MSNDVNYRVKQWQPPARPEWVQRINAEGRYLDLKGVVPLDEQSLLCRAKANTGLSDFGEDDWYEPFKVYVKGIDEEADLTLMGRIMTRSDLLMHLEARLRITDTYNRHPEIDAQELSSPMLIIGSGRSGTSMLQNLLSFDPDNGTPKHWETLLPCPPPEAATYHTDPRIAIADKRMTQWERVTPQIASMHEWGGDMPTEIVQLETMSFQSTGWLDLYGFSPTYGAYMAQRSMVPALSYVRRILKLLQWKNPRKRWLWKNPDSLRYLPAVMEVFPDLKLIWLHRDPLKTVSSMVSLVGTLMWIRCDRLLDERAIGQLTNPANLAGLFDRVMDQIEQGSVPEKQIHNVQYVDLVDDPMGTVERLYRDLGIELSERAAGAMSAYLREHPREARPPHKYSVGDADRIAAERKLFERYENHFHVKREL
jgi:hypothetical protein